MSTASVSPFSLPTHIVNRKGETVKFDAKRITNAINKAREVTQEFSTAQAEKMTGSVILRIMEQFGSNPADQESIQNLVEDVLMIKGHRNTARKYILHREKSREVREMNKVTLNIDEMIDDYIDKSDWRVNENANMGHSFQGLILHTAGTVQAKYILNKYSEEIRDAHVNGFFHIHDLSFGMAGYCAGWSLRDLLLEGFNLRGRCCSGPAKHLGAACGQIVNFLGTLQNEWAGAQAFNNVDTYLAPFIRVDNLNYKQVKQIIQKLVFNLNTTSRWGGQSPFTNFTFDMVPPKHIAKEPVIIGGAFQDSTYGEYAEEMKMINKAFIEVMLEGDMDGRIFSFPIPTYNVTEDFPWDSEAGKLLLKLTAKYGVPYFQNFINSDLNPEDVRSMCCRLQMDLREIRKKTGGLFGAGDLTGSIGVVTLNLPKLAYLANHDEEKLMELITHYAVLAKNSLEFKRKFVQGMFDRNLFPFSKRYLKNEYRGHFSTIGLIGGNEACLNFLGKGIETEEGKELAKRVVSHVRSLVGRFQEETGNLYNFESTPGEGTCYRLAKIDAKHIPGCKLSGTEDAPYYTNSTLLPVGETQDVFEALMHQNELQPLYNGGTVFHSFLGEAVPDEEAVRDYLIKAMSLTKLPYISVTPTFSICESHGYLNGEQPECPKCKSKTEVYTRIVGYYRPVERWNKGKQSEYKDRKTYTMKSFGCCHQD